MTIGANAYLQEFDSCQGSKNFKEFLAKEKAMSVCIKNGIYATLIKETSNAKIGTRADYFGMREGDNIYFFFNRCIYGIGEIVSIDDVCAFYNTEDDCLYDECDAVTNPFICLFKSTPQFFRNGVDMDEVLLSNPNAFRKLRFFHNMSFNHIDDKENLALKSYIIQKNEEALISFDGHFHYDSSNQEDSYNIIKNKFITDKEKYTLNSLSSFLEGATTRSKPFRIKSEFLVEGMILDYAKRENRLLGYWDFMSRQYVASPNKPAEYADNMDVFGYRYVKGYKKEGIISKYIVIEIKADEINEDTILQTMKYVDWVCKEFAHNDYSMIEAYMIGYRMKENLLENNEEFYTRNYIKSSKHNANRGIEVETDIWQNLKYISYVDIYNEMGGLVE